MPDSLSIIIPAFNEAQNIEAAINNIVTCLPALINKFELIIVDDGSTDETGKLIRHLGRQDIRIKTIHRERNSGKGAALAAGFRQASMEWILFTDADLQIDISELSVFLSQTGEYDVVIGCRAGRNDSFLRRLFSKGYALLISTALAIHAGDVNCPFKLFRRDIIRGFEPVSHGFLIDAELLYRFKLRGYQIKEIPVAWHPRHGGKSSVRFRHFIETLQELFILLKERRERES